MNPTAAAPDHGGLARRSVPLVWRAVLFSLLAVLGAAALLFWGGASRGVRIAIGAPGETAWFTGFYPAEQTPEGAPFRWSSRTATVHIPTLVRSVPYRASIRVRAGRPDPALPRPYLTLTVDGAPAARTLVTNAPQNVIANLPPRAEPGMTLGLVADTFVPGPSDRRTLGVILDAITIAPAEGWRMPIPPRVLRRAIPAAAAYGLAAALCAVPLLPGVVVALLGALAHAWLLSHGAAFLTPYAGDLLELGVVALAAATAVAGLASGRLRSSAYPEWPIGAFIVILAGLVKLAVFYHPAARVGDALFHAHRFEWVMAGRYFFTSITPRPYYEFPYPIALYVLAAPLGRLVHDHVLLLRAVTVTTDTAVAFLLYLLVRRYWQDRTTALAAAALYNLAPINAQALCTGNLTNVFGQAALTFAMAFLILRSSVGHATASLIGTMLLLAIAFLSHFSTLAVGCALVVATIAALSFAANAVERRSRLWIAAALALATALSYGLYYAHFHAVYRAQLGRIGAGEGRTLARSMAAPAGAKLRTFLLFTGLNYGSLLLVTAAAGLAQLAIRHRRDPLTLALWAWLLTTVGFAVLGVVTPLELRAPLAAQPVVAVLAALPLGYIGSRHRPAFTVFGMFLAGALTAYGLRAWMVCLGGT